MVLLFSWRATCVLVDASQLFATTVVGGCWFLLLVASFAGEEVPTIASDAAEGANSNISTVTGKPKRMEQRHNAKMKWRNLARRHQERA